MPRLTRSFSPTFFTPSPIACRMPPVLFLKGLAVAVVLDKI